MHLPQAVTSEQPPMILVSPVYDAKHTWVPGSSTDYTCMVCARTLVVSPASLRHMRAWPGLYVHLCSWCTDQVAQLMARQNPEGTAPLQVALVPGADAELRAAGLDDVADSDQRKVERLRKLFRGE